MKTFADNGIYTQAFDNEVVIYCPKCQKDALIVNKVRVICKKCGFSEEKAKDKWHGPSIGIVRRRCRYCGRWLEKKIVGPKHTYEAKLKCPGCHIEMIERIVWSPLIRRYPCDPHFGYKLWFVGSVRGNTFWAYNRAHLHFIKSFVSATLRNREPNKNNSLASRLPGWLLSKKNRASMVKEINRLEKKHG